MNVLERDNGYDLSPIFIGEYHLSSPIADYRAIGDDGGNGIKCCQCTVERQKPLDR